MTAKRKINRGQFQEGSERAREMGRLGGQKSSRRKHQNKDDSPQMHPVIAGEENS